jgi:hypothetical protein
VGNAIAVLFGSPPPLRETGRTSEPRGRARDNGKRSRRAGSPRAGS